MKKIVIIITVIMLACYTANAQNKPGKKQQEMVETMTKRQFVPIENYDDSIPPVVYDYMTNPPVFQGGLYMFEKILKDSIKYPAEAWNDTNYVAKDIKGQNCIVRTDGVSVFLPCDKMHPALNKEVTRVMSTMPKWGAATLKGKMVDIVFTIQTTLFDPYYHIPLYAMPMVKESMKAAEKIGKKYTHGISKSLIDDVAGKIYDIYKKGWSEMGASLTGAKLMATTGNYDKAAEMLWPDLRRYHRKGFHNGRLYFVDTDFYYRPLHELEAVITLAAIYDMGGNRAMAEKVYGNAIELIGAFIEYGISGGSSHTRIQHYYDLMNERVSIVKKSKSPSINLNSSERREIDNEPLLTYSHSLISDREQEGKIGNARAKQIENQMYNMNQILKNKKKRSHEIKLHKLCAMLIGLRDGKTAEKNYIASLANNVNIKKSVAKQMERWSNKLDDTSFSRQQLIDAIVLYAPLNTNGNNDDENRKAAAKFYKTRNNIEKVYPLAWIRR